MAKFASCNAHTICWDILFGLRGLEVEGMKWTSQAFQPGECVYAASKQTVNAFHFTWKCKKVIEWTRFFSVSVVVVMNRFRIIWGFMPHKVTQTTELNRFDVIRTRDNIKSKFIWLFVRVIPPSSSVRYSASLFFPSVSPSLNDLKECTGMCVCCVLCAVAKLFSAHWISLCDVNTSGKYCDVTPSRAISFDEWNGTIAWMADENGETQRENISNMAVIIWCMAKFTLANKQMNCQIVCVCTCGKRQQCIQRVGGNISVSIIVPTRWMESCESFIFIITYFNIYIDEWKTGAFETSFLTKIIWILSYSYVHFALLQY